MQMGLFYYTIFLKIIEITSKNDYSFGNILYSDLSNAKIPQKIIDRKIKPTVNPAPLPKDNFVFDNKKLD